MKNECTVDRPFFRFLDSFFPPYDFVFFQRDNFLGKQCFDRDGLSIFICFVCLFFNVLTL